MLPKASSAQTLQEKEVLVKEKAELSKLLSELGRELQQAKARVGEENKTSHDLAAQLDVSNPVTLNTHSPI